MHPTQHIPELASGRRARGFTMLELVLVIALLAIMATIAVRSLEGVQDQARFDQTRTQLTNISNAIVGNRTVSSNDGNSPVFSFVSDVGRLPQAVGSDPTTQLQELWSNPNNLPPLAVRQATASDPAVWLAAGWRGDYLQLGVGQTSVRDGWGNPYDLFYTDANGNLTACTDGQPIQIIRSRGADGQVDTTPTTGFDADQWTIFYSMAMFETSPPQNLYSSTLSGSVYFYDPVSGQVEVPNPSNGNVVVTLFSPGTDPSTNYIQTQTITIPSTSTTFNYTFANVPVGQRVLRAYQYQGTGQPPLNTTPAFESIPVRLNVQPGAEVKDLTMISTAGATTQPSSTGG